MFLVCRGGVDWREGVIRTNVAAGDSDIRVLRIMVGWHDTEGFASLHPRLRATRFARAFDLSGRAGGVVLPRIFTDVVWFGFTTDLHK